MDSSKPVLIAYDGSEGSKAAIDAAGRLFPDRRAIVVSVWHSAGAAAPASLIAIPAAVASRAYEELDSESERQAAARVAEGVAAAEAAGLEASGEAVLCAGKVWATIVNAADEADAQAIVVGSRGLSAVKSALVGSVANGVLHHSTRPVVVAPTAG
ncbi:MAG TPA: universal stress protein [Thermoleophilaceae bacterium]|nr:universal stress protein [Thermoleophilaceae bacterium]